MKKTVANIIANKIKKGEMTMRSKLSILLEKMSVNGSLTMLFGLLVIIAGFVFYWVNSNNDLIFGGYGQYGLTSFFQSFPYIFVVVFILIFIFLIKIFRKFDFSYKKPFTIILLFILTGILLVGWISIKQPIGQKFYQREGRRFRMNTIKSANTVYGTVVYLEKDLIVIQGEDDKQIVIKINSETHFPFGQPKKGDIIRSVGIWKGSEFIAVGVRVFDDSNYGNFFDRHIRRP